MAILNEARILVRLDRKLTQVWASRSFSLSRNFDEILFNSTYPISFAALLTFILLHHYTALQLFVSCLHMFTWMVRWWRGTSNSQQAMTVLMSLHPPAAEALLFPSGHPATASLISPFTNLHCEWEMWRLQSSGFERTCCNVPFSVIMYMGRTIRS